MWLTVITGAIKALGLVDDIEKWLQELRLEQAGRQQQAAADTAAALAGDQAALRTDDAVRVLHDDALDERLRQSLADG